MKMHAATNAAEHKHKSDLVMSNSKIKYKSEDKHKTKANAKMG